MPRRIAQIQVIGSGIIEIYGALRRGERDVAQ